MIGREYIYIYIFVYTRKSEFALSFRDRKRNKVSFYFILFFLKKKAIWEPKGAAKEYLKSKEGTERKALGSKDIAYGSLKWLLPSRLELPLLPFYRLHSETSPVPIGSL